MAIIITEDCINCGACEPECPNNAIYEGSSPWRFSDGTSLKEVVLDNVAFDASIEKEALSDDFYYIVTDKCTECVGFYEEPQCAAVCPVNCCILDVNKAENKRELMDKKNWLHGK